MTTIETARLLIRIPKPEDFEILYSIHADPLANIYNPGWTETKREDFQSFFDAVVEHHNKFGFGYYVLQDKEDRQVFGLCGLRFTSFQNQEYLNLYYRISPSKTRKGFVKEAAKAIVDAVLSKTNKAYPILALTTYDNIPSRKTAESLGLQYNPAFDNVDGQGNVYYFSENPDVGF